MKSAAELISAHLRSASELQRTVATDPAVQLEIGRLSEAIADCLELGGKLLLFGNGGSAAQAQHFAAELVGRYGLDRAALPALALTSDSSVVTALGNDFGFEAVFKRQVEALARPGDVVVGLTTSATSLNVLSGVKAGKECGALTALLVGRPRRPLLDPVDFVVSIPSTDTPRIQEIHLLVIHIICDIVERLLHLRRQ